MDVILGLETSCGRSHILLWRDRTEDCEILYDSDLTAVAEDGASPGVAALVEAGLAAAGVPVARITAIVVNIGPGGLGAVRSGVAFANGLGFALGRPVWPVTSFELVRREVRRTTRLPILYVLPAGGANAYGGVMVDDQAPILGFGPLATLVPALTAGFTTLAVAGHQRGGLGRLVPELRLEDSGIAAPGPRLLIEAWRARDPAAALTSGPVIPLTDDSRAFRKT